MRNLRPLILIPVSILIVWAVLGTFFPGNGGDTPAVRRASTQISIVQFVSTAEAFVKEFPEIPLPTNNKALVKLLSGENPKQIVFVDLSERDQNPTGEAIDRWGTPYRFYPKKPAGIYAISAGPDKIWDTKDDLGEK